MQFKIFANYLERLENTTKRLEITTVLAKMIKELDTEEVDKAIYLSLGYLSAPFNTPKFNMAEKMLVKVLSETLNKTSDQIESLYGKSGDMGNVFLDLDNKEESNITIQEVHTKLMGIAKTEGSGSQESKIYKTKGLLENLDKLSGKYVLRIILGTTRLGFTELTVIDALAEYLGNKGFKTQIEQKYNMHPDIGRIAKELKHTGIEGLDDIKIEPGIPILLQKAQRVKSFEEVLKRMETTSLEYKLDGTRVQMHLDRNNTLNKKAASLFEENTSTYLIKTFTRNLEDTTQMYPDLLEGAKKQINADSIILDGEAIGYNPHTGVFLPFQEMMQRKRKHGVKEMTKEIPLRYFVFDILYLNGENLMHLPLEKRREMLKTAIKTGDTIALSEHVETKDPEKLYEYFDSAKEKGLEGLIAKNPQDQYQAGARSYSWIKLKVADEKLLEDSVDCVILGYYFGKGARAKFGIGGLLLGIYDEETETFKTISKLGTGLTEEELELIKGMCDKYKIKELPKNVLMNKMFEPDVFISPQIVLEVGSDEVTKSPSHSAGYALRFPRMLKVRTDKSATQATSLKEIEGMYKKKRT